MENIMKICTKCGQKKLLSEFAKDKSKKDGHMPSCKDCKKVYDTKYIAENKDKKYAANYAYNADHREEKKLYDKKRRSENRDVINAKKRAYYQSEDGQLKHMEWRAENYDKISTSRKNTKHKRREIIRSSKVSGKELRLWTEAQDKVCAYCEICCQDSFHIDHIYPLSRGGLHELQNLAISCPSCNSSKGNKTIEEWQKAKDCDKANRATS
jgi:5-methylcytosine-specific restriction endonuclease McrA